MDTLVFDIETKNFFSDPDVGWNNFDALKISTVGVYSYGRNEYRAFEEHELSTAHEWFEDASLMVGFGINRYDIPVLNRYFLEERGGRAADLWKKERIDLLEEIELATGERISLDKLAHANLGTGKTGRGSFAIELYKQGRIEELKAYCLTDVELTKRLFDIFRATHTLLVPDRSTGALAAVSFNARHYAHLL